MNKYKMKTWIKTAGQSNQPLSAFQPGDLVNYWLVPFNGTTQVGEIVAVEEKLVVHYLQRQREYGGKLWRFDDVNYPEHEVDPICVVRHVQHARDVPLTRQVVKEAWDFMGYVVGVEDYCLKADEDVVPLDMGADDSESEEEEDDGEMDDFIVPDEEGEAFCPPNPDHLSEEQRKWVNVTHSAVRGWDNWAPANPSQQAVKSFVDNMDGKYHHREDERRFQSGLSGLDKPQDL